MRRSWTIGQQLAFGFAIPILLIIGLGTFSHRTSQEQIETARLVAHSEEVIGDINELLSELKDAELAKRGFVITGKENYLDPYRVSIERVDPKLADLRAIIADNPRQQARFDTVQPLVDGLLKLLEKTIDLRRREGIEAAAALVSTGESKRHMDEIRRTGGLMIEDEEALLKQRAADAERAAAWHTSVIVGGSIGAILLVLAVAGWIARSLRQQIGASVQNLQSASSELQAAATQQTKGATAQVGASAEASATMRELVATSRQIADSAQRVTQVASDTAAAARSGEQTVQAARGAIETVKQQVDRIVGNMLELGKRSQDIGAIVDLINELAEQTNILAINATIEAAGAGDAGRRFAVIADEIRRLADRVGGSTKDIRGLIEEVRAAANTTVMSTEDGAKAADACARQFGEMTASFTRIAASVASTAEASREIELGTRQQTTAVEQASTAIAEVAQTARETDASSAQTLDTAVQLALLARQLVRLIREEEPALP